MGIHAYRFWGGSGSLFMKQLRHYRIFTNEHHAGVQYHYHLTSRKDGQQRPTDGFTLVMVHATLRT